MERSANDLAAYCENTTPFMEMVDIPPGNFVMGSPENEEDRSVDKIEHTITLSASLYACPKTASSV